MDDYVIGLLACSALHRADRGARPESAYGVECSTCRGDESTNLDVSELTLVRLLFLLNFLMSGGISESGGLPPLLVSFVLYVRVIMFLFIPRAFFLDRSRKHETFFFTRSIGSFGVARAAGAYGEHTREEEP